MLKATFRLIVIASVVATPFASHATPGAPLPPVLKSGNGKMTPGAPLPPVLKNGGQMTPGAPLPPVLKNSNR